MNDTKKGIVLVDFAKGENVEFLDTLNKKQDISWDFAFYTTNMLHGNVLKSIYRQLLYFVYPLLALLKFRKYDYIIGWQQFYALNLAFWLRLFHMPKNNHITVMTFIYKPKGGIIGKLYDKYMKFIVNGKYIERFIVFSKEEVAYYTKYFEDKSDRFVYIPLGLELSSAKHQYAQERFVFGAGRSNRDWDFVCQTLKDSVYKVRIACDSFTYVAHNIEVLNHCYDKDMYEILKDCYCVVIPLKDKSVSSGQLMMLQAKAFGKPVIATRSNGITDYIVDNETGLLIENDPEELREALDNLYNDKELYDRLSAAAIEDFNKHYSISALAENVHNVIVN